jgi:hypothetical protein
MTKTYQPRRAGQALESALALVIAVSSIWVVGANIIAPVFGLA